MDVAATRAVIHEIFSGIQGEGLLVGLRQIFVRFHGCNLRCAFCDTSASQGCAPAACAIETAAGTRHCVDTPNPLTVETVLDALQRLNQTYPHHSVSLTGGEPLLHRRFLDALLPRMHEVGLSSFLETNGVPADELGALHVMPHFIGMDIKLPSVAGGEPLWKAHAAFLDVAVRRLAQQEGSADRLQVKIVFGEDSLDDIALAADLIAHCRRDIPCILQPVTSHAGIPASPSPSTVLEAQRLAATRLSDVRVIPQTQVMLKQW
ncbi:MAG TPA: 7-carboxy-7-deazaguanine synthase QueE [Armatimonadota bacterium]|nr:7-carboxy-7-deazaguanine synthase QueE [Armatimonadota bacterium]